MFLKKSFFILLAICPFSIANAQNNSLQTNTVARPKLVVGIVIDQMRWDYLYRYNNRYSKNGFNRLITKGHSFENTLIPYVPTYTAPGHTCIYTGGVPATNGIIGNNWFDKTTQKNLYCTEDNTVKGIGNDDEEGKMSPRNMWATTIGDELRLGTNFESKVIGIALKDRGAILPAGHSANAAYWYDDKTGKWITSDYYMNKLPDWVNEFNNKDLVSNYMKTDWTTLYPISTYTQSTKDDMPYEDAFPLLKSNTFPYRLSTITKGKYSAFKLTPSAATFTFNFAKNAITNEKLGAGKNTDFLAVSISSTDYMGHTFGPNSVEAEDTYLRLDKDIADFLQYLDITLGKDNYLVFLSADHGVAHIPSFLQEQKLPNGVLNQRDLRTEINKAVEDSFGLKSIISNMQNHQLYIDFEKLNASNEKNVLKLIMKKLRSKPYITHVFETANVGAEGIAEPMKTMLINGYNPSRSGDIQFTIKPGYFDGAAKGTTHGLWNPYDAHIPLLFYGWHIKPGSTNRETYMTDIAPTLAALLHIQMPSGSVGKVLTELIK